MAKNKYYVDRNHPENGVYTSWAECEAVKKNGGTNFYGYPSMEAAEAQIAELNGGTPAVKAPTNEVKQDLKDLGILPSEKNSEKVLKNETNSDYDAIIYVDGSYRTSDLESSSDAGSKKGSYAYGMKVIDQTGTHYFARAFAPDDNSSLNNVAGEVNGATAAIHYAVDHNYSKIHLLYDYNGIEAWCKPTVMRDKQGNVQKNEDGSPKMQKRWDRNRTATKNYADLYDNVKDKLQIDFEHVYGHTGVDGNEVCDALAKSVLHISDSKLKTYAKEIESAKPYISNSERIINKTLNAGNKFLEADEMSSNMDRTFE